MSEQLKTDQPKTPEPDKKAPVDSFGNPVEKSPWVMFAFLQIPIVLIMLAILYFMYQARDNS